ncbi:hypothetical protein FIBSPDRAFT_870920 [Athelia psychrophila]|uniref:Uncharacterized protein n=1 Tax=Athelia psychrophila TaxID=1759441 RepID=A0A166ANF2_9AGAM|nr:hypothetical protein FIBSPDRAFT_870920 [Fibularhizoctonia sp. CBS 109695]
MAFSSASTSLLPNRAPQPVSAPFPPHQSPLPDAQRRAPSLQREPPSCRARLPSAQISRLDSTPQGGSGSGSTGAAGGGCSLAFLNGCGSWMSSKRHGHDAVSQGVLLS